MSAGVTFILLDLGKDPIKLSGSDLAATEFANSRDIHLQWRAAIGAVQIGAGGARFSIAIADKRPVFTPAPQVAFRSCNHLARAVNSLIIPLNKDAQRDRVVKRILLDLPR